jgi:threonine synthase
MIPPTDTLAPSGASASSHALTGLRCHVCHATYPATASFVCQACFGPLEPVYDYARAQTLTRAAIASRPRNLWRCRELLPSPASPHGFTSGWTPLVRADRLAARLGQAIYIRTMA